MKKYLITALTACIASTTANQLIATSNVKIEENIKIENINKELIKSSIKINLKLQNLIIKNEKQKEYTKKDLNIVVTNIIVYHAWTNNEIDYEKVENTISLNNKEYLKGNVIFKKESSDNFWVYVKMIAKSNNEIFFGSVNIYISTMLEKYYEIK